MFGGVALVAKAERVIEKTMINRVNDVIIITIDGAKERIVMSAKTLNIRAVAVPVVTFSKLRLTLCAYAEVQKSILKTMALKYKNIFLTPILC